MKNKKLADVLKKYLDKNINVKIGCKQGSSFFYCHKLDNATFYDIDKQKREWNKSNKEWLEKDTYKLKNIDKIYEQETQEQIDKGRVKNVDTYHKSRANFKQIEIERLTNEIALLDYCIKTPFLERQVCEIRDGICLDEMPCKIIYIKGCEKGKYWTIYEFMKKNGLTQEEESYEELEIND